MNHGLITGDLQLNGILKDSNGNPRIFSNWTIASNTTDLYRPAGNVGIGTTDPSEKLQVNGRLRIEAADHSTYMVRW